MITCNQFSKEPDFPGCCSSCHADNEEYGYWLTAAWNMWDEMDVCCKVASWLEKWNLERIQAWKNEHNTDNTSKWISTG